MLLGRGASGLPFLACYERDLDEQRKNVWSQNVLLCCKGKEKLE